MPDNVERIPLDRVPPKRDRRIAPAAETHSEPQAWGYVDEINPQRVVGWAWNPDDPTETLAIDLLDDDRHLLTLKADRPRPDLLAAGIGTGNHGFAIERIGFLLPKSRHLLRLRCARTGAELPGSPRLVTRPDAGLDDTAADFIDSVLTAVATQSTSPALIDQALALVLARLSDLVNARFRLESTLNPTIGNPGTTKPAPARPDIADLVSRVRLSDWTHDLVTSLLHTYLPIHLDPAPRASESAPNPTVSIIIPVHDKFTTTYDCIETIRRHLPKTPIEIIIVDDGSRDETLFAALVFTGAIRVVRTPTNGGFIEACNYGASQAQGDYLFFLNNDTLVREHFLDTLVETFDTIPDIGIAGSRLFFPDGTLQEVGGIIWKLGDGWNWGRHGDPAAPHYNHLRDADYVSGAALMIRRSLFEQLDGFDRHYLPAYYEDTDLCFRVRAAGLRVVVQPASEIVHLEGISNGTDTSGTGLKRYQQINHRKFFLRWKSTLDQHRMNSEHPELEAERLVHRRAYFIDDTILTPDQDAGSNAALQHILALQHLGYKVTFIPSDNMARIDPFTRALEKYGVECLYAPYFWSVEEVLRKATIAPDLVYFHRFANASKYASMVREKFPKCRLIYNVADIHFLREEREADLTGDPALRLTAATKRRRELAAMQQVDCVIVHSPVEAGLLRTLLPETHVEIVSWAVPLRPTPIPFAHRAGYGFVGGFRHPPNVDAVKHFADTIMPHLPAMEPHRFVIIGSNMPPEVAALHGPAIDIRGHVPTLSDALNHLRCTIAPLRYGAGVKGKVLESFAHGLPCLMSEIAAEGLPIAGDLEWLIARTPADFAEKLTRLCTDQPWNAHIAAAGLAMMQSNFSSKFMQNQLQAAVAS